MSDTKDMFKNGAPSFGKTMLGTVIFLNAFAYIIGYLSLVIENAFKAKRNTNNEKTRQQ